jgi:predicted RND superfamily exporter protein
VLSGIPIVRARILNSLIRDQFVFVGAGLLVIFFVLFFIFRSGLYILLSLSTVLPAYILSLGCMGIFQRPLNVLTSALPLILAMIGLSDNIHLLVHYRQKRHQRPSPQQALLETFTEHYRSCFFTMLTTAIGFLSLMSTRITIVVDFAIFTALGLAFSYLFSMTLFPILLTFFRNKRFNDALLRSGWISRRIDQAYRLAEAHRRPIVVGTFFFIIFCSLFVFKLETNTYLVDDLRRGHPLSQELKWVEKHGFGLFQVNVFLQGSADRPLHRVEMLRWMDRLQQELAREPLVMKSLSLADYLRQIRRAVVPVAVGQRAPLPRTTAEASQLLLLNEMNQQSLLADLYHQERQLGQLIFFVTDGGSQKMLPFLASLQRRLEQHPPPSAAAQITGTVQLAQNSFTYLLEGMTWSVLLDLGLILLIMAVMFKSLRLGLLALVPNLVPLTFLWALVYWLGYDLKPSTILVYSIAFGLAVDDTIHLLGVLRHHAAREGLTQAVIRRSLRQSGRGAIFTCLVLSLGFSAMMLSMFQFLFQMGLLTACALGMGLLADLLVLPALLLNPRRLARASARGGKGDTSDSSFDLFSSRE